MAQYIMEDADFGTIDITVRSNMVRMVAKWKNDQLHISLPPGVLGNEVKSFINSNREELKKMREHGKAMNRQYYEGQVIPCFGFKIELKVDSSLEGRATFGKSSDDVQELLLPRDIDFSSAHYTKFITTCISRILGIRFYLLEEYANKVAAELGCKPQGFVEGHGYKKLGHCTSKGEIQLSRYLLAFPESLIRYIICHELAHLSHMDHSLQFHALCNKYCGGREAELESELRRFVNPVIV